MKRTILTALLLVLSLAGAALAQNPADEAYIKAMQANSAAERVKLLKDFIAQFGGKGSQYESYAYAALCVTQFQLGQLTAETIGFGEKALQAGGIDDVMKGQVMTAIAAASLKLGQLDKAKTTADQVIQFATTAKAKEAEAANAAVWNNMLGGGHYIKAQALEKAKDIKGALDAYNQAYAVLKQAAILAEVKKLGSSLYNAKDYSGAEQVYRFLAQTGKDPEAANFIAQIVYKQGRMAEALTMFKENYEKRRTGEMAYNIGILLATEAKTDPALTNEAITYLIDAGVLGTADPKKADQAIKIAQSLFFSQDKEWNNRVKAIQESTKLIEDWTKTINTKFGEKSEDELTADERREYRKLTELIDQEKKTIEGHQAQQKATSQKWDSLIAGAKKRLGK
jgi:tetratricopeptide (TPR) repeat protein